MLQLSVIGIFLILIISCKKDKTTNVTETELSFDNKIIKACSALPHRLKIDSTLIYVPSIFTPNNDLVNDRFFPFGYFSDSSFKMTIRLHNQIIYTTNNKNDYWNGWINGIWNGTEATEDLYSFEINALSLTGNPITLNGDFVLLRNIDTSKVYPSELCNCPTPDRFRTPTDSITGDYYPNIPSSDNLHWSCE